MATESVPINVVARWCAMAKKAELEVSADTLKVWLIEDVGLSEHVANATVNSMAALAGRQNPYRYQCRTQGCSANAQSGFSSRPVCPVCGNPNTVYEGGFPTAPATAGAST